MKVTYQRVLTATLIFDLEDRYAREQGVHGLHPQPIGPLKFQLMGKMIDGNRQDFATPLPLAIKRNPSGYHLFFDLMKQVEGLDRRLKSAQAPERRLMLADGVYIVRVQSTFYQMFEHTNIKLPMQNPNNPASDAPYHFDLEPSYAYPFANTESFRLEGVPAQCGEIVMPGGRGPTLLRGSLHASVGQDLVGITVQVVGSSNLYRVDETGQWVLWFPDDHPTGFVVVRIMLPNGGGITDVPDVCVIKGRTTSLFETALRGWVQRNGRGVHHAMVTIEDAAGPLGSITTKEDGSWSYYFSLLQAQTTVTITATLPDEHTNLTIPNIQVRPRVTEMVPTFRFP